MHKPASRGAANGEVNIVLVKRINRWESKGPRPWSVGKDPEAHLHTRNDSLEWAGHEARPSQARSDPVPKLQEARPGALMPSGNFHGFKNTKCKRMPS